MLSSSNTSSDDPDFSKQDIHVAQGQAIFIPDDPEQVTLLYPPMNKLYWQTLADTCSHCCLQIRDS